MKIYLSKYRMLSAFCFAIVAAFGAVAFCQHNDNGSAQLGEVVLKAELGDIVYKDKVAIFGRKLDANKISHFTIATADSRTTIEISIDGDGKCVRCEYSHGDVTRQENACISTDLNGDGTVDKRQILKFNGAKIDSKFFLLNADSEVIEATDDANGSFDETNGRHRRLVFDMQRGIWAEISR